MSSSLAPPSDSAAPSPQRSPVIPQAGASPRGARFAAELPGHYRVTVEPSGDSFVVQPGENILAAGRRAGVWLPFECGWGACGTCKLTLIEGQIDTLFDTAPAIHPRDARRGRILACQSAAGSDLVVKATRTDESPRTHLGTGDYTAHLAQVDELAPDIRRFRFRLDRPTDYREGQFAVLELGPDLRRCYSMAATSGERHVEFIAKRYAGGRGSERLFSLPLGSVVPIELPYGDMWLRQDERPIYLIAGGTGVSAILALAHQLAATNDPRPVRAFYGATSVTELVGRSQLAHLLAGLPDGHLHATTSTPSADVSTPSGYVTDALAAHADSIAGARIYLAGPPPMVDAVLKLLSAGGQSIDTIHYDRFG